MPARAKFLRTVLLPACSCIGVRACHVGHPNAGPDLRGRFGYGVAEFPPRGSCRLVARHREAGIHERVTMLLFVEWGRSDHGHVGTYATPVLPGRLIRPVVALLPCRHGVLLIPLCPGRLAVG